MNKTTKTIHQKINKNDKKIRKIQQYQENNW